LGLVCISRSDELRFRTITRTRCLALHAGQRRAKLAEIYADNLSRLFRALEFCDQRDIRLYRMTSGLFPMNDDPAGEEALEAIAPRMAGFATEAERLGIRVLIHPDQYVVLSSDLPGVVEQSVGIMRHHARVFDMLGLPRTTWAPMILHGGKGGRADRLVEVIGRLPASVRERLVLENDESAYGAADIFDVCRRAGVPMVFDAHHHVVREKLAGFGHRSVARFVAAARGTWPDPAWQIVHLSNGVSCVTDPRHSDLIGQVPPAYRRVPWVEVEAKGKEEAIAQLRALWPGAR
jgi:UV DNA damage endonuclease